MSENSVKSLHQLVSKASIEAINEWVRKYPVDQKQSAVMSALMIVQEEIGYLHTELMDAVAEYLDMPPIAVYEVATFYSMYEHKPVGRHKINVCTNISCQLRGSKEVVEYLESKLKINVGGTTEDKRFTLRTVECLGACTGAPMMQVNKDYYENLTNPLIDQILEQHQ